MSSLYISDYLRESIASRNIRDIRGALLGYVEMDPAFKTNMFLDAVNYVVQLGIPVYADHDPSIFADPSCPDKDRFYQIQTNLHYNFSKERVQELISVGRRCMLNASVYSVTDASLNSQSQAGQPRYSVPTWQEEPSSKKTEGQDQRVATRRIWAMAALVAILAVIIILVIALRKT